jgi:ornithine cyclodeaminase
MLAHAQLILGEWLRPGVQLDLIGSFTMAMREADSSAPAPAFSSTSTPHLLRRVTWSAHLTAGPSGARRYCG